MEEAEGREGRKEGGREGGREGEGGEGSGGEGGGEGGGGGRGGGRRGGGKVRIRQPLFHTKLQFSIVCFIVCLFITMQLMEF